MAPVLPSDDFRQIVDAHKVKVFNVCYRFVSHTQEAEDLAQDVFIEVYQKLDRFRGEAELATWIYRIAVNKSLSHIRSRKRLKRNQDILETFENAELVGSNTESPEFRFEQLETSQQLNAALVSLEKDQRTAFILSKVEGFSMKEIAQIMDKSISAVESLNHRAKQNLKKKLKTYYEIAYRT